MPGVAARWPWSALAAASWIAASTAVAAQATPPTQRAVTVAFTLERIVAADADSTSVQVAGGSVASHADQLIVSVRFTNASAQVVDAVRITSSVPADVQYLPGSASGPGSDVLFSVDNGRTFGRPEELTLPAARGSVRAASAADYTHVRWILRAPLAAGAAGVARYRAVPR